MAQKPAEKGRRLKLRTKADFVKRLSQAPAMIALEELIWNAFDERAITTEVKFVTNELKWVKQIEVLDDGHGLRHELAADAFQNLGSSNKVARRLETGEHLHGRKGEGRHKALSLGNNVTWHFTYADNGKKYSFEIIGSVGREDPFYLSDKRVADPDAKPGCRVVIKNIQKSLHNLLHGEARLHIASQFAPFLLRHSDRTLVFNGRAIRPSAVIESRNRIRSFTVFHDHKPHSVSIEVIHWKYGQSREVQLCSKDGIPLHQVSSRSISGLNNFSVFASSDLFDSLHEANLLSTVEMTADSNRKEIVSQIRQRIRKYFRRKLQKETDEALQRLREEGSYPYRTEPKTDIDRVERKVFDICTVNINRHLPSFSERMDVDARKLLLRIIKEAISQNPTAVGKIIREVCKMPSADARTFARLIDDVPLSKVVNLAHMVANRLTFLKFFESIVYLDPFDQVVKERTQLHRILAQNTWLFGEEYATGTDDENLESILQKHVEIVGREHLQPEFADADIAALIHDFSKTKAKTPESLARIPDLMLWRVFPERRPDEYEFVVIEIKRPGVAIGRKEMNQIEDYARAVTTTPFADFDRTRWVFILISDQLDEHAHDRAHQDGLPPYTILKKQDSRYEIRAIPWSQLIRTARARHNHLEKWLNFSISRERVIEKAQEAYSEFLPTSK